MWTGEVEMKVWMRPRSAGLIASPQRSMSICPARERPHTTPRLVRLAIRPAEIALGRDRETGLDDVDAHVVKQFGDLELFLVGHGGAGRLLAIAQGGVEDNDAVLLGLWLRGHGNCSFFGEMAAKIAPARRSFRFRPENP